MIEGLRLLPWFQEAARRELLGPTASCDDCMQARSKQTRQLMGCGYEPSPAPDVLPLVFPWQGLGYTGPKVVVCPGYTTTLPEVIEIARSHLHWSKGSLTEFCRGLVADSTIFGIEILEGASNEMQHWSIKHPIKDGG